MFRFEQIGTVSAMASLAQYILRKELQSRQIRNPSYSLRALSRDLDISLTALSSVLNNQRSLSAKNIAILISHLDLSPQEIASLKQKSLQAHSQQNAKDNEEHFLLAEDEFRLIADWFCLAILNLAKMKANSSSVNWIAARLAISETDAQDALSRLIRLGLIKITGKKMLRTAKPLTTSTDVPSVAIRKHHRQNLILAEKALNDVPVELREFSSVTMLANHEKIPKVKEILLKTRKKIADLLEDPGAEEVYTLAFQLFPLTQNRHTLDKSDSVNKKASSFQVKKMTE